MTCITCLRPKAVNRCLRCRSCAQNTVPAKRRNRENGRKGGLAAGIRRRKYGLTPEYRAGYQAGWIAGRRAGFAEALGEDRDVRQPVTPPRVA